MKSLAIPEIKVLCESLTSFVSLTWMLAILVLLERCTSLKALKQIHGQVFINGLQRDNYVAVKLVSFCSKTLGNNNINHARKIFDTSIRSANVFLWTTMITSYSNHHSDVVREAILVFKMMHQYKVQPNNFTLSAVLKACSLLKAIREGQQVHALSTKLGYVSSTTYVLTALLDMYVKFGYFQESKYLYETMPERSTVTCNSMIACYSKAGNVEAARRVFDEMPQRDSVSLTAMVFCYADNGNVFAARELFDQMLVKEINSWNALILCYSDSGLWKDSLRLFCEMLSQYVKPNLATLSIVMSASSQLGVLEVARQLHGFLCKNRIEMNVFVCNSLVDMYAKCGSIHEAYLVFTDFPLKDVVSYNVMISGFSTHGHGQEALKLFSEMLKVGICPDTVTFLGILNACNQVRNLELAQYYYNHMKEDYGVEPSVDHYACMVDLYGRTGFINMAYDLVKTMPVKPHAGVWGALLNACSIHGHVEIGESSARELFRIEPENPGNYVILSNIYARAQLWDGVKAVRCLMRGLGVAKMAGFSLIELNDGVHEFVMGDVSHPLWEEIHEVLSYLPSKLV